MLSEAEIANIAETISGGNRGHAEKLYLQDIILSTISRATVDELVFKGGTALKKLYQLDRFSEDLDFTQTRELDEEQLIKKIVRDLENFGATVEDKSIEEVDNGLNVRLGIQGPLYQGDRISLCFIRIDINRKSDARHVSNIRCNSHFPDIQAFTLAVLPETEILAEKIRAICTRQKPRDLYDIYHLQEKGVAYETQLVKAKLDYYDLDYSPEEIVERARGLETNWESLASLIYSDLPPFERAIKSLKKLIGDNQPSN